MLKLYLHVHQYNLNATHWEVGTISVIRLAEAEL